MSENTAPTNLDTPEEQLERRSLSPEQEDFNPHPATSAYSSLYCPQLQYCLAFQIADLLATLSRWHQVCKVKFLLIRLLVTSDYVNKLFISSGKIDHNMAEDLQSS